MLSVCIITKNEQQNIERCLKSLKPYDLEVIVVDTGSTDKTKEVAAKYTSNIYDFPWCDDFAAAKNFAISKATNAYALVLDSDEYIEQLDMSKLVTLIKVNQDKVGRIRRKNILTKKGIKQENKEWINRIFNKELFHYEGRIHEQVVRIDGEEYATYETPITILHTGYDLPEEEKNAKAQRNIKLLEQELIRLEAEPDTKTAQEQLPYILYQLGKSYYLAAEYLMACEYFAKGLSFDLNPKLEYVIDMVETYGYALINSGQAENALFFENIYEEFGSSADFQFLMGLIYMNNAMFEAAVEEFFKATKQKDSRTEGVNSYLAYYNVGVIYECLGDMTRAEQYYKKCGSYEPARKRLYGTKR